MGMPLDKIVTLLTFITTSRFATWSIYASPSINCVLPPATRFRLRLRPNSPPSCTFWICSSSLPLNPLSASCRSLWAHPFRCTGRQIQNPGCWSLGLTWAFRRSKLLRFHSILSLRFRYFAKLCNYVIRHHTPLIVFSMEMAPCCLGLMVCGCLHHNVIAVYYTFDVYRSPLSSSC